MTPEATPPAVPTQTQNQHIDPSVSATTTFQQDLTTKAQREVNKIWEYTQSFIAVAVTLSTLYVSASLAVKDQGQTAAFLLLSNAFFLVVGFYFGRTNHQRTGGVGYNPSDSR